MNEQEVNNLIADAFEKVCEIMGFSSAIHPHFHDALFSAAQQIRQAIDMMPKGDAQEIKENADV